METSYNSHGTGVRPREVHLYYGIGIGMDHAVGTTNSPRPSPAISRSGVNEPRLDSHEGFASAPLEGPEMNRAQDVRPEEDDNGINLMRETKLLPAYTHLDQ
jgi:hypothetical protein